MERKWCDIIQKHRHRRRIRKSTLFLLLFLLSALLVSCTAGGNAAWVRSFLGADTAIYRSETVIQELETDGETAKELCSTMEYFLSGTVILHEFRNGHEALRLYRDEMLNALLRNNYASYVGNPTLTNQVSRAYPHVTATVLIPEDDLKTAASHCLGLSSASNGNGEFFSYLSRASCYTTPSQARALSVSLTVRALEETEHTYRLSFQLEDVEGQSAHYSAMFVKRPDGSAYLKALSAV